jgi:hypothetical protein
MAQDAALFRDGLSPFFKRKLEEVLTQVAAGTGVDYVDLSELPLPIEYFKDADHVNRRGSEATREALWARLPIAVEDQTLGLQAHANEQPTCNR